MDLDASNQLDVLDDAHRATLERAVSNILDLEVTVDALAQILDGLPTPDGLLGAYGHVPLDHPVALLQHDCVCDGFVEKVRAMRSQFALSRLSFETWNLLAYQDAALGSPEFHLRLIELVVVSCHQIAAHLYDLDSRFHAHSRELTRDWYNKVQRTLRQGGPESLKIRSPPQPVAFCRHIYDKPERCPRGEADIVGYWAESRIFGGVIVFDRGPSKRESRSMWLQGELRMPYTLYPPTAGQFQALVAFLLSDPDAPDAAAVRAACPLPIRAQPWSRPRWDPYEGLTKFHIFRDENAVQIPEVRYLGCTSINQFDWPEICDTRIQSLLRVKENGEYDPEELALTKAAQGLLTPTSPRWYPKPEWHQKSIWRG